MIAGLLAMAAGLLLAGVALVVRALRAAERDRKRNDEMDRIIDRAEREKAEIDARVKVEDQARPGLSDRELEDRINR